MNLLRLSPPHNHRLYDSNIPVELAYLLIDQIPFPEDTMSRSSFHIIHHSQTYLTQHA